MNIPGGLIWALIFLCFLAVIALLLYGAISKKDKELEFIEKHKRIRPGMSKRSVVQLLGDRYTQSFLKNGVEKLEWRYKTLGYTGRIASGFYVHSRSTTRRISVKFKDNIAIEVNSYNMD